MSRTIDTLGTYYLARHGSCYFSLVPTYHMAWALVCVHTCSDAGEVLSLQLLEKLPCKS